jgi:hypothetical protein
MAYQTNDRIELYSGTADAIRADVLKVSSKGDKLYVSFWGRGLQEGKLVKSWVYSTSATLIRQAA